ncbi:MAG: hypothetical protein GXO20_04915 [Thermodesulfobacteria bacterium]|nr:hypothetical protein [Thermodesulfobacteriota bacterium]
MAENIPQELLDFWKKREEIAAIYLLPTSTPKMKDILLWITQSNLSYFDRLDLYYPREKRKPDLHVYPITKQEFESWPESIRKTVQETLRRSKLLWKRQDVD